MKSARRVVLSLAPLVALAAGSAGAEEDPPATGTEVGQVHPDVRLPEVDGSGVRRLSDLRGRKVLLLHFASW